jgi:hypothetical protein
MIFTDKFVYVHMPKTGGTFVTNALYRLYRGTWDGVGVLDEEDWLSYDHPLYGNITFWMSGKHAPCRGVPEAQRSKPIFSTIRNPYDWYVSQYEFGWWKREEYLPAFQSVHDFAEKYPRFPDISFPEFVLLINSPYCTYRRNKQTQRAWPGAGEMPGVYTEEFLHLYFREPRAAYARLDDDDYIRSRQYTNDMFDVQFVPMLRLNENLYRFLLSAGYRQEDVAFILGLGKILPQGRRRGEDTPWTRYYTPELKHTVRAKGNLIFDMFPAFDV